MRWRLKPSHRSSSSSNSLRAPSPTRSVLVPSPRSSISLLTSSTKNGRNPTSDSLPIPQDQNNKSQESSSKSTKGRSKPRVSLRTLAKLIIATQNGFVDQGSATLPEQSETNESTLPIDVDDDVCSESSYTSSVEQFQIDNISRQRQEESTKSVEISLEQQTCDDEDCSKAELDIFWCPACDLYFCRECWARQLPHKKQKPGHELIPLGLKFILESLMSSKTNVAHEHLEAYSSRWFGVSIDRNDITLDITDRYRKLADTNMTNSPEQSPALISFVGETGAGKSSLVNALIKIISVLPQNSKETSLKASTVDTPVVGDVEGSDSPTSSDVHLFADPKTRGTLRPFLYADCEGLEGGNRDPRAITDIQDALKGRGLRARGRRLRRIKISNVNQDQRCRDWMVKQLYPRILFTFSDLICYVTRNLKTFEAIVGRLLEWADGVLEHSVNQPLLPAAIIVVNAFEPDANTGLWYDAEFTKQLFSKHNDISKNPTLNRLALRWRSLGSKVESMWDLAKCYYSDIQVVCIPHHKIAGKLFVVEQYQNLYSAIEKAVGGITDRRRDNSLLWSWNDLEMYLGYAFDHYSQHPMKAFNFLNAAFRHYPVRSNFRTHILMAALRLINSQTTTMNIDVFNILAPLVSSSILLDVYRKRLPNKQNIDEMIEQYKEHLEDAYKIFYNDHWPCSFTDPKGRKCVNVLSKHHKGHQTADGKIFGAGGYMNNIEADGAAAGAAKFISVIKEQYKMHLGEISKVIQPNTDKGNNRQSLKSSDKQARGLAATLQKATLNQIGFTMSQDFQRRGSRVRVPIAGYRDQRFTSDCDNNSANNTTRHFTHNTCFACLLSTPRHVLACGHLLCDNCVDDYSKPEPGILHTEIRGSCPFCNKVWALKRNPSQTASRVLCLDGGGMLSIIQLKILQAIEKRIDLGIPIQNFFDLIIGTSAGGLVALGLGISELTLEQCTELFRNFATKAFTPRRGLEVPGLKYLVEAHNHSQFKSRGLREALRTAFGEKRLFGDPQRFGSEWNLKVGVTLTASSGHPYLVANYNRPEPEINSESQGREKSGLRRPKTIYGFLRGENKELELKVWEAALATTAAPRSFKPFHHKATGHVFSDGGLCFNNPVAVADKERQLLWPTDLHIHPDILLSLGTGRTDTSLDVKERTDTPEAYTSSQGAVGYGAVNYFKRLKIIVSHQTRHQLDSHRIWDDYLERTGIKNNHDNTLKRKYCRIDMPFQSNMPKMHQVEQMGRVESSADEFLALPSTSRIIDDVSAQLVASLFYIHLESSEKISQQEFEIKATILCRLKAGSPGLERLCNKLRNGIKPGNRVFKLCRARDTDLIPLGDEKDASVFEIGNHHFLFPVRFTVPRVSTLFRIHLDCGYLDTTDDKFNLPLISGFPCTLDHLRKRNSEDFLWD